MKSPFTQIAPIKVEGLTIDQIRSAKKYLYANGLHFCERCDKVNTRGKECHDCWRDRVTQEKAEENRRFHHVPVEIDILVVPKTWNLPLAPKLHRTGHVTGAWPEAHWPDVACQFAEALQEPDATSCYVDILPSGHCYKGANVVRSEGLGYRYVVVKCDGKWSVKEQSCTWVRIPGYGACD